MMLINAAAIAFLTTSAILFCSAQPMNPDRPTSTSSSGGVSHETSRGTQQHGLYERLISEDGSIEHERCPKTKLIDWFRAHRGTSRPLMYDMLRNYLVILQSEEAYGQCRLLSHRQKPPRNYYTLSQHGKRYQDAYAGTIANAQTLHDLALNAEHFPQRMKGMVRNRSDAVYIEMVKYKNDLANVAKWANEPLSYKNLRLEGRENQGLSSERADLKKTEMQIAKVEEMIADYQASS